MGSEEVGLHIGNVLWTVANIQAVTSDECRQSVLFTTSGFWKGCSCDGTPRWDRTCLHFAVLAIQREIQTQVYPVLQGFRSDVGTQISLFTPGPERH